MSHSPSMPQTLHVLYAAVHNYCIPFKNNDYSLLRLYSLCIDVTMVRCIQACHQTADVPGSALPLWHQYANCTALVGSNHCFQGNGAYRNSVAIALYKLIANVKTTTLTIYTYIDASVLNKLFGAGIICLFLFRILLAKF